MILASFSRRKKDQSPLGRTVQLLRILQRLGMNMRIGDRKSNRHSIGKWAFCLHVCFAADCKSLASAVSAQVGRWNIIRLRRFNIEVEVKENILPIGTAFH